MVMRATKHFDFLLDVILKEHVNKVKICVQIRKLYKIDIFWCSLKEIIIIFIILFMQWKKYYPFQAITW